MCKDCASISFVFYTFYYSLYKRNTCCSMPVGQLDDMPFAVPSKSGQKLHFNSAVNYRHSTDYCEPKYKSSMNFVTYSNVIWSCVIGPRCCSK